MEKRLTIGFIDEDSYDEYHNLLSQGVYEYAQKHGMRVIRFGHFLVHSTATSAYHERTLLDHISRFRFDGLIFWNGHG